MIEAALEKLTLSMTVALDRMHYLNLQYHCKTVSRQSKVLFCWPEEKIITEKESTSETVLQVNSFIRGYHEYQEF